MAAINQKSEFFSRQHSVGIELLKEDLADKAINLIKIEELVSLLTKNLTDKLSEQGSTIFTNGLNQDALGATETEMRKQFRSHYEKALRVATLELNQGTNPTKAAAKAQAQFAHSFNQPQREEELFQYFLAQLREKGQEFAEQDIPHLREAFHQYVDKTVKTHTDFLNEFQALESVKASLLLNDESLKSNSNASMTAQELKRNQLNLGPKVGSVLGYSVDINNLRKQLKHTLARLKPGEKINIEVTKPDRDEIQKNIAETSLHHRSPLLGFLLLMFLYLFYFSRLGTSRTEDEQRLVKTIKDLAQKDGLIIDPSNINVKTNMIGKDGKTQTISEGPLDAVSIAELNKAADNVRAQIFPMNKPSQQSPKPSSYASRAKEEEEEEEGQATKRPALTP